MHLSLLLGVGVAKYALLNTPVVLLVDDFWKICAPLAVKMCGDDTEVER